MSLLSCPECSGEIPDTARACPHCAYPIAGKPPPSPFPVVQEATAGHDEEKAITREEVLDLAPDRGEDEMPRVRPPLPRSVKIVAAVFAVLIIGGLVWAGVLMVQIYGSGGDDVAAAPTVTQPLTTTTLPATTTTGLTHCEGTFSVAASVSDLQDTVEDLYPTAVACESIEEWLAASARFPKALDGAVPLVYLGNICLFASSYWTNRPLCKEVADLPEWDPAYGLLKAFG